jgi:phosphate starvation-inducible protein PhoH and related proteins
LNPLKPYTITKQQISLEPNNARSLANLCGHCDANLREIEQRLDVSIHNRGNTFQLEGSETSVHAASELLLNLYAESGSGITLTPEIVHLSLQASSIESLGETGTDEKIASISSIRTPKVFIKPRGKNQKNYVQMIRSNDINFGIGPAGTGKTYLAVACAVEALEKEEIQRILLVRPAVEAGEKLGFLPGDLSQKVDPYLRPLYDALYEMIGFERVEKLIERHAIEIAPLAFMRGRTLNNSFIILDESQNTTREQMKMFLTRIGYGSTAVITGDITQVDLAGGALRSGLKHALEILDNVNGISFTHFSSKDVVRHPLVQRIVEAYSAAEDNLK